MLKIREFFDNLNKLEVFLLGMVTACLIILFLFNHVVSKNPIGRCTITGVDGIDTVYENCLANIVVSKEQGNFFKYTRYTIIGGLK